MSPNSVCLESVYQAIRDGDWADALEQAERLIGDRNDAATWHAVGLARCGGGHLHAARDALVTACRLDPGDLRWARDAAAVQARLGLWAEVFATLSPGLARHDDSSLMLYLMAGVKIGEPGAAVTAVKGRRPTIFEGSSALLDAYGRALIATGAIDAGLKTARHALARYSESPSLHELVATALDALGRPDDALDHWQRYAALIPDSAYALMRLALAFLDRGRCDDSRLARHAAERAGLGRPEDHSCRLYLMLSDPAVTPATFLDAARGAFTPGAAVLTSAVSDRAAGDRTCARHGTSRQRLRIGYLSAEFRSTPSFYFSTAFLRAHDRAAVEVILYNTSPTDDGTTAAYQQLGDRWRHCAHATAAQLSSMILSDKLDVLVDISGHFPHNRLPVLVERLATIHACYPHFPGTTGCPGIDYLITDDFTSPEGTEHEYSERLWRLKPGYLAFTEPTDAPMLGAPAFSTITFGVFQRLAKFTPVFLDVLARVLTRLPRCRLLIHNSDRVLDQPSSQTSKWLVGEFRNRGVDTDRLVLQGPLGRREHLALAAAVDVALDTFPYGGQTTTCESLWMGVPVITMLQNTHASRVSASLLTRVGCTDTIARTLDEYVDIGARLAGQRRASLDDRIALRAAFVDAGLTNGRAVASGLEAAYRRWIDERC